jgi:hypothetical protein
MPLLVIPVDFAIPAVSAISGVSDRYDIAQAEMAAIVAPNL